MLTEKLQNHASKTNLDVFTGVLLGGLAGAGAMLLLAPQSGARTRFKIQQKSLELRDQTSASLEAGLSKVWLAKQKLTRAGRRKTQQLLHLGQAQVAEKLDDISTAAKAWKKANLPL